MENKDITKLTSYSFDENKNLLKNIMKLPVYSDIGFYTDAQLFSIKTSFSYCTNLLSDNVLKNNDEKEFASSFCKRFNSVFSKANGVNVKYDGSSKTNAENKPSYLSFEEKIKSIILSLIFVIVFYETAIYFVNKETIPVFAKDFATGFYAVINIFINVNYGNVSFPDYHILVSFFVIFLMTLSLLKISINFLRFALVKNEDKKERGLIIKSSIKCIFWIMLPYILSKINY